MLTVSDLGAIVVPPVPAFYHQPASLQDLIDHTVGKLLSLLGLPQDLMPAWLGPHR
jgi:4-hydroxy-3-polyprenylbenzoate decarboxylase